MKTCLLQQRMQLETIMLTKICHSQKDKYHVSCDMWQLIKKLKMHRNEMAILGYDCHF